MWGIMVREIKFMEDRYQESVIDLLDEAKEQGYTNIIVIGFKEGKIYTALTKNELLQTLGALRVAEEEILLESRE